MLHYNVTSTMLCVHTDKFMKVYLYSINSVTTMVVTTSAGIAIGTGSRAGGAIECQSASKPSSSGYCRLKFISLQLQKGQSKVKDFRGLLDMLTDGELRKGLEHGTQRFLASRRINIELEDLMGCAAAIYHGLEVKT